MFTAGVDPSKANTGLVIVDESGWILINQTGTWQDIATELENPRWRPLTIVVEQSPRFRGAYGQVVVEALLLHRVVKIEGCHLVLLFPATWKPVMKAWWKKLQLPSVLQDQHQRDAYSMAVYHLLRRKHEQHDL